MATDVSGKPAENYSDLKTETASSSETMVTIYQITLCHSPEDVNSQQHSCENLKFYNDKFTWQGHVAKCLKETLVIQLLDSCVKENLNIT
jgi:hypothetical protein